MSKINKKEKLSLKNSKQVDGKIEELAPKLTSLDALFGTNYNKYSCGSLTEYEEQLNSMNTADLRAHAVTMGFMPSVDINRLKRKLVGEFQKYANSFLEKPTIKNNLKLPPKNILDIMADVK